jgi:hypothetical protein
MHLEYSTFHLKRNSNYSDTYKIVGINRTRQTRFFFQFLFVRKNLQNSFAADVENLHHLLEDKHPPFLVCFVRLCEVFLGKVGNSLFNTVFQFLQVK